MEELLGTGNNHERSRKTLWTEEIFYIAMSPPPRIAFSPDAFTFDLQRFTEWMLTQETTIQDETSVTEYKLTATGQTEKSYDSLSAALSATEVASGDTIKLGGEITGTSGYIEINNGNSSKKLTLDLNGHNIMGTGCLDVYCDFTLQNTGANQDASLTNTAKNGIWINSSAKFTLESGQVNAVACGVYLDSNTTFTMNGGTINATSGSGVYVNAGGTATLNGGDISAKWGVANFSDSEIVMKDTNINATALGIQLSAGSLKMESGSIKSTSTGIYACAEGATVEISGTAYIEGPTGISGINGASISMSGGEIKSVENSEGKVYGSVQLGQNEKDYTTTNGDSFVMTGGKLSGASGVNLFNGGAKFVMDGGEIETTSFAISNNGNNWVNPPAKITIKSGSITSTGGEAPAIYHAGAGTTNIEGGTIKGASGIEIRAGELNVTGGTIEATASDYEAVFASGGSSSKGAGIAIVQHATTKPIEVNVSGNNTQISGANALAVANPQNNDGTNENTGAVSATISGATFKSTATATSGSSKKGNAILADNANVEITVTDGNFDGNVTVSKNESATPGTNATALKMQGGTTTGTVKVVKVATSGGTETTETDAGAKEALQVTGGTYSDTESAKKYTTNDVTVNDEGEVINAGAGWTARDGSENAYDYLVKSGGASATLISATIGADSASSLSSLKADAANYLLGVHSGASTQWGSVDDSIKSLYGLATFNASGTAITLTPQTEGFKIKGTTFIGSNTTALTASGSTGINVDATNNKLTNITGGAGNDNLLAGDRNTTLDGGDGDDTLQGGTGNDSLNGGSGSGKDLFYYTAGNDTVSGFNTGDLVRTTLSAVTDGSKLTTVTNGFKLDFGNSNTLTFTDAAVPVSLSDGSSQYIYTQDLIKQGSSVTLAAGVTNFDVSTQSSLASIMAIDGSAVTGDLTITDNINNNSITFGKGKNTFNYKAGNDVITGYDDSDVVNLTGDLTAPTDFNNAKFDGSDFKITLGSGNSLTFTGKSNVALLKGNDTYTYKGHSNGGLDYIAQEGKGITLGAGHTSTQYNGTSTEYETINASAVTQTIRIRGNDKNNYIVGNNHGGELLGYEGVDTITAGGGSTTLDGGAGDDLLIGSNVEGSYNQFVYSEGNDSIQNYQNGKDVIKVSGREVSFAEATVSTAGDGSADLLIKFDEANQLSIAGGATLENPISVTSGRNNYTFTKDYMALEGKGITLASGYSNEVSSTNTYDGSQSDYVTINAAAVNTAISVMGNSLNNYIFGPTANDATLNGGSGNDRIDVSERGATSKYVFEHDAGKDEIFGFNQNNDSLKIAVESITAAKTGNSRLTLTIAKDNSIVLRGDDDITQVSIQGSDKADYLTKDGYVTTADKTLKLFSSAKGRIDLGDDPYKTSTITAVDATSVEKQSVTLVGGTQGGTFTYATGNKKRDGFVYGGGNVKIVNYEASKDRIDLNAATFSSFSVNNDVVLAVGTGSISITGAAGQEVLLRNGGSRSFKKMVFAETGVLQNKSKNPTSATVSGAADSYTVGTDKASIKKIYVEGITKEEGIQINAGNKNNTIIDASKAEKGVTLSGGNKNDKLIGNTVSNAADTFIYGAGKDIIQNFSADDTISIGDENTTTDALASSLSSAKITAGSKSIKFKFSNKNTLTVKAAKGESLSGALNINETTNTYAKNAIADSTNNKVTLTDKFSGTFKTVGTKGLDGITVETVDGSKVSKNLTFKGSEAGETLEGGSKKNTFKGGGGNDSLKGGDGKDIFFYAKGDKGTTTIANFEFGANKDRLKIASGTIGEIKQEGTNIQFAMNSGKKGDTSNIAWFNVEKTDTSKNVAIKANNTFYWFADEATANDNDDVEVGQLITSDTRVSSGDVSDFDILELNYSTNLAKSGVAVKVTGATPTKTNG